MSKVRIFLFAVFVFAAYVFVNDPNNVFHAETNVDTPIGSVSIQVDNTPGHNIFNPDADLDTSHVHIIPCDTDIDCVTKNPTVIPDAYTINAYIEVYGDAPQFPTEGDCSRVDWLQQDEDGRWFVPQDLDGNGKINCNSDLELGA